MQKSRTLRLIALSVALCLTALSLCGCTNFTFEAADTPSAPLPEPDTSALVAPTGDSRARYSVRTTLYYRTGDNQLSSALRLIYVDPEDDPLRLIMESLLETPYSSSGLLPIAPQGTKLNEIRLSGGVAMVDLSAQALSQGEEYFFITRSAIAKTLLGLESVQCVNVMVEGRAVEVGGVPLGALTEQDTNAAMGYIQHMSEQLLLETDGGFIERCALMYLPGAKDRPLEPACVPLRLSDPDPLPELLSAFVSAVQSELYPAEELSRISAQTQMLPSGKRVLALSLPGSLSSEARERLVPALIASLCSFAPNIDAASVAIGGEEVLQAGPYAADADGLLDPQRMCSLAGTAASLYFMAADGSLVRTEHLLEGHALTARELLAGLMAGPASGDAQEEIYPVFPQGAKREDILGVRIENSIAHVNLSASLYGACQAFTAQQERALVYAIVNTLVDNLDTVLRVQFYVDGAPADTFAGSIAISSPLMANPGLVR
ncbi:MAG: GerMN domain-containing protein [Clostridia bacterium]|nr:GerMN domain-containing protein [Clostridia bacterium]